ncbi:MAG: hypothetical protein PHC64_00960 [Candidatus Gastranaerophilales bacterium]|nr:hypothetical protein [Candidatus Gastranaerophilales bacterium]
MNRLSIEIKLLVASRGLTLKHVAQELGKILGKTYSLPNLSKKLNKGTISHEEVRLIADILGYDVKFIEKNGKSTIEELL